MDSDTSPDVLLTMEIKTEIKSEEPSSITIDLDAPTIEEWDLNMRRLLMPCYGSDEQKLNQIMKDYSKNLQWALSNFDNVQSLLKHVTRHLRFLYCAYQYNPLKDALRSTYLCGMEILVAQRCSLNIAVFRYMRLQQKNREIKRYVMVNIQETAVGIQTHLLGDEEAIMHALMRIEHGNGQYGKEYCNGLFHQFAVKKIPVDTSDRAFCRAYILFAKWKEINSESKRESLNNLLFNLYKRQPGAEQDNTMLKSVRALQGNTPAERLLEAFALGENLCRLYFDYMETLREVRVKRENRNIVEEDLLDTDSTLETPVLNLEEESSTPTTSNFNALISTDDTIEIDDDVEIVSTKFSAPVCVIEDSDESDDCQIVSTIDPNDCLIVTNEKPGKKSGFLDSIDISSKNKCKNDSSLPSLRSTAAQKKNKNSFLDSISLKTPPPVITPSARPRNTSFLESIDTSKSSSCSSHIPLSLISDDLSFLDSIATTSLNDLSKKTSRIKVIGNVLLDNGIFNRPSILKDFENATSGNGGNSMNNCKKSRVLQALYSPEVEVECNNDLTDRLHDDSDNSSESHLEGHELPNDPISNGASRATFSLGVNKAVGSLQQPIEERIHEKGCQNCDTKESETYENHQPNVLKNQNENLENNEKQVERLIPSLNITKSAPLSTEITVESSSEHISSLDSNSTEFQMQTDSCDNENTLRDSSSTCTGVEVNSELESSVARNILKKDACVEVEPLNNNKHDFETKFVTKATKDAEIQTDLERFEKPKTKPKESEQGCHIAVQVNKPVDFNSVNYCEMSPPSDDQGLDVMPELLDNIKCIRKMDNSNSVSVTCSQEITENRFKQPGNSNKERLEEVSKESEIDTQPVMTSDVGSTSAAHNAELEILNQKTPLISILPETQIQTSKDKDDESNTFCISEVCSIGDLDVNEIIGISSTGMTKRMNGNDSEGATITILSNMKISEVNEKSVELDENEDGVRNETVNVCGQNEISIGDTVFFDGSDFQPMYIVMKPLDTGQDVLVEQHDIVKSDSQNAVYVAEDDLENVDIISSSELSVDNIVAPGRLNGLGGKSQEQLCKNLTVQLEPINLEKFQFTRSSPKVPTSSKTYEDASIEERELEDLLTISGPVGMSASRLNGNALENDFCDNNSLDTLLRTQSTHPDDRQNRPQSRGPHNTGGDFQLPSYKTSEHYQGNSNLKMKDSLISILKKPGQNMNGHRMNGESIGYKRKKQCSFNTGFEDNPCPKRVRLDTFIEPKSWRDHNHSSDSYRFGRDCTDTHQFRDYEIYYPRINSKRKPIRIRCSSLKAHNISLQNSRLNSYPRVHIVTLSNNEIRYWNKRTDIIRDPQLTLRERREKLSQLDREACTEGKTRRRKDESDLEIRLGTKLFKRSYSVRKVVPDIIKVDYDKKSSDLSSDDRVIYHTQNGVTKLPLVGEISGIVEYINNFDSSSCDSNQNESHFDACNALSEELSKLSCSGQSQSLNLSIPIGNAKQLADAESEFSNSPKLLEDSDKLVQRCLQETSDNTSEPIVNVQTSKSYLSNNSNFYESQVSLQGSSFEVIGTFIPPADNSSSKDSTVNQNLILYDPDGQVFNERFSSKLLSVPHEGSICDDLEIPLTSPDLRMIDSIISLDHVPTSSPNNISTTSISDENFGENVEKLMVKKFKEDTLSENNSDNKTNVSKLVVPKLKIEKNVQPNALKKVSDKLVHLPTVVPESYDFSKDIDKNDIFSLIDTVNFDNDSDNEVHLPLKKRKLPAKSEIKIEMKKEDKEEISYPATPMISIAEVEALKYSRNLTPTPSNRPFKTPAERKEMPPISDRYNLEISPSTTALEPSPIITDQFNINNHTYNNPTINYHMNHVPLPFNYIPPCGQYYPLPSFFYPFNNVTQSFNSSTATSAKGMQIKVEKETQKTASKRKKN